MTDSQLNRFFGLIENAANDERFSDLSLPLESLRDRVHRLLMESLKEESG